MNIYQPGSYISSTLPLSGSLSKVIWMQHYLNVAHLALEEDDQLLEVLSIVVK